MELEVVAVDQSRPTGQRPHRSTARPVRATMKSTEFGIDRAHAITFGDAARTQSGSDASRFIDQFCVAEFAIEVGCGRVISAAT